MSVCFVAFSFVAPCVLSHLVFRPLQDWRERLRPIPHLIYVSPEDSVMEASSVMLQHNIHRVGVLDQETHTVMFLLTHSVILNYLMAAVPPSQRAAVFGMSVSEAGLLQDPEVAVFVPISFFSPFVR